MVVGQLEFGEDHRLPAWGTVAQAVEEYETAGIPWPVSGDQTTCLLGWQR